MKLTFQQRVALDRLVAGPLCMAFNFLAYLLGCILRRNHSIDPATTRQIAVSKLVGMGSILQATPLLRALKQRFPHARLTFITLIGNRDLVQRLDEVDEVLCLDDRGVLRMLWTTISTVATLMRRRVDHYFDLEVYSSFTCLLSLFSMTQNRLGFYRFSNRFRKGIYTHLVYFNTRMAVRRTYLQLGRVAGIPADAPDRLGLIRIEPADRTGLWTKLAALGLKPGSRYILINPNASDLLIERRWPESHMVEALQWLAGMGHDLVLLGARSERPFVERLRDSVPAPAQERVFNTAGLLTLGEALALIEGAACVLTNDTGPMHMAFALAKPTVCLVGPADPVHYGCEGPDIVTLYAPVSCSPCIYEVDRPPCRGNNVCMQRLATGLVVEQVLTLLSQAGADATKVPTSGSGRTIRQPLEWNTDNGQPLGIVFRPSRQAPQ
jgi:ADP-heptose:LPS heptosyltransferase